MSLRWSSGCSTHSPHGEVDFIDSFAARIPVEVIGNLLDIPGDERGPLRAWSIAILSGLEPKPSAEMLERGNRAVVEFKEYLAAPGRPAPPPARAIRRATY